jgi:hypothetical protein
VRRDSREPEAAGAAAGAGGGGFRTGPADAPAARTTTGSPAAPKPTSAAAHTAWDGAERRGPNRAKNVARLPKKTPATTTAPAAATITAGAGTGTEGEWESF